MHVEARVVRSTDTVIDPGAVVVVTVYASVANVAVATLRETNYLTERAQALRVKCLKKCHHAYFVVFLDI